MKMINKLYNSLEKLKEDALSESVKHSEVIQELEEKTDTATTIPKEEEEWIWVEGYKGTCKDMTCQDFQYEIGIQYDMPEGEKVVECENGFHLCLNLRDVFDYYQVGGGNRFFKVKALVRKKDKLAYDNSPVGSYRICLPYKNKLVAKSIILISELTRDEILKGYYNIIKNIPVEYRNEALELSPQEAITHYQADTLIEDGYSCVFADYIIRDGKFDIAHAIGSQDGLSMDMKVLYILHKG